MPLASSAAAVLPSGPRTLAFAARTSGAGTPFLVLLHGKEVPDTLEWRSYLRAVSEAVASGNLVHSFVVTDGGGPTAAQRKELAAAIEVGPGDLLTHVFTTDRIVRGIVTAFAWITKSRAVAHSPGELSDVCGNVGLPAREVLSALNEVEQGFGAVQTLALIHEVKR